MPSPTARALHALRQVKHLAFVLKKRAGWKLHMLWVVPVDPLWRVLQRVRPMRYDPTRYPDTFLARTSPLRADTSTPVPRVIFAVWAGDNPMSEDRRRGLESVRALNPGIEIVLVTRDNLSEFLVHEEPLHPAYEYLSNNHRSDFLRGYLLHHHGGGYCDVKPVRQSWAESFDELERSDRWLVGYTEVRFDMVPKLPGRLGRDLVRASAQVLGNGSFIARARTPLTDEWHGEQLRRLDAWDDALRRCPGDWRGKNPGYPVSWLALQGDITGPLCLKYQHKIIHDPRIMVRFKGYM